MFNIALNTFREIIRNKFFGLIAFLGVVFILLSMVLDTLALGEARRVLFDFGLSFIEITGFAIVLFLGGGMIDLPHALEACPSWYDHPRQVHRIFCSYRARTPPGDDDTPWSSPSEGIYS